jgi:aspartate 1-decarboxylase
MSEPLIHLLKCKIHRATVTDADLDYEGSISLDPKLIAAAGLREFEVVDIYNINNGARFSTYVIKGEPGDVCLNGAAARLVAKGDLVIICAFVQMTEARAKTHEPTLVFVDGRNRPKEIKGSFPAEKEKRRASRRPSR